MVCVVIFLCFIPLVLGHAVTDGDDVTASPLVLELHSRLSILENVYKEAMQHLSDLKQSHKADQRRIAYLESYRQTDLRRITILETQGRADQRRISELENQQRTDHERIVDFERDHQTDQKLANRRHKHDGNKQGIEEQSKPCRNNNSLQKKDAGLDYLQSTEMHLHNDSNSYIPDTESKPDKNGADLREKSSSNYHLSFSLSSSKGNRFQSKRVNPINNAIAFYAYLTHSHNGPASHMEIDFDHVVTNIGNSYSQNTGTFICPRAGVYMFFWNVHVSNHGMYTELVRDGVAIGGNFAGDSEYAAAGGNAVIVQLNPGDEIWIRVSNLFHSGSILSSYRVTSFSGVLLFE